MTGEILEKIESAGVDGIKQADLKKVYGKDCESTLEKLKETEQIFVEKKGVAYFVWTKENYVHHLTQNDPKFKLMFNMVVNMSHSLARMRAHTETLQEELERFSTPENLSNDGDFEKTFNTSLNDSSTSIGWVPFGKIREKVCETHNLTEEKFYQLASNLIEKHREQYEISSGGKEGITVRGLVHGYVRSI